MGGIIGLTKPRSSSTFEAAVCSPSSGVIWFAGDIFSRFSVETPPRLEFEVVVFNDPIDAKEVSRERPRPSASFCCPNDSKDGRLDNFFSEAGGTRKGG
jgi:hypothetical protein